jgi:hypothetical protein
MASTDPLVAQLIDAENPNTSGPPPVTDTLPGRLWAIADLHLSYKTNREELEKLQPRPNDGLILAGDIGETAEQYEIFHYKVPLVVVL